jgi:Uncharacterized protein conserved in bacteria
MFDSHDSAAAARRAEQEMIAQRKAAAARWPQLLEEIRQVPGFEDFALPPPMAKLHEAAGEGTVVAITVTNHGCGALTLTRDTADYLELPDLTAQAALDNANAFLGALYPPPDQAVDTAELMRVLEWLWDAVTGPVLDQLGHTATPADVDSPQTWPRVWWIPTGALTVLPLHAAGHHNDPPDQRRSVLDRVVSSYTPSVRALGDARRAQTRMAPAGLAVGINQTADPSHRRLRKAEKEASQVNEWLGGGQLPLLGQEATHDAVVARLPGAAWAHFSCHGYADNNDPAQSFLALYDGPLRANELFTMRLDNAYLAYLSACTTARGSLGLLDENIHLASAFQLAGYPHVIATLWPIIDRVSADLARDVYAAIHPDPHTWKPPAFALHTTIRTYRDLYLQNPQVWASHIHLGP